MTTDLFAQQARLDQQMATLGIEKFRKNYQGRVEKEHATDAVSYRRVMMSAVEPFSEAIDAFLQHCRSKKVGRRHSAAKLLATFESSVVAFIVLKMVLDGIVRDRKLTAMAIRLGRYLEVEARAMYFGERDPDLLAYAKARLARPSTANHPSDRCTSLQSTFLRAYTDRDDGWEWWTKQEQLILGLKLVELLCVSTGLFQVVRVRRNKRCQELITPTERFEVWIAQLNGQCELLSPEYLPCVIEPKDWDDLVGGGYHTDVFAWPLTLVKTRSKVHKRLLKQADLSIVYKTINTLQRTPWRVNKRVLEVAEYLTAQDSGLAGLPEPAHTIPPRPEDYATNKEADKAWRAVARHLHDKNASLIGQRIGVYKTLSMARDFVDYEAIYFPYQLDFRGRIYSVVSYLQPQGAELAKGLLMFSKGDAITTQEARDWLAIHGANVYGLDKVAFRERLQWVKDNEQRIVEVAASPLDNLWWAQTDSPFCFLSWCMEWADLLQAEERGETFISRLPVALDGSCNGLQHYSAMLRDPVAGEAVNLTPSDSPQDIYKTVAQEVEKRLRGVLEEGDEEEAELARRWLDYGICRKITKRPVMVLPYGGTFSSCKDYVREAIVERGDAPYPPLELPKAINWLAGHVWRAMGDVVVSARLAMDWLRRTANVAVKQGSFLSWEAPTGFPVYQNYPHREEKRIDTVLFGSRFQPRYTVEVFDVPDKVRQSGGVAPNFVHSLDASALSFTVNEAFNQGITNFAMIHDSYGTTAAKTAKLAVILRDQFVKMYESIEALELFLHATVPPEVQPQIPPRPFVGGLDLNEVRASGYFFA